MQVIPFDILDTFKSHPFVPFDSATKRLPMETVFSLCSLYPRIPRRALIRIVLSHAFCDTLSPRSRNTQVLRVNCSSPGHHVPDKAVVVAPVVSMRNRIYSPLEPVKDPERV